MATLREIANKGAELNQALTALEALQQAKQTYRDSIDALNLQIDAQLLVVNGLKDELKAMLP